MKKLLSILGTIGLTATSTTTLISCEKPDNSENSRGNKPESEKPKEEQPPENSNWKLIDSSLNNIQKEFKNYNDKWYFIIWKRGNNENWIWQSMFFKYNESAPRMTGAWLSSIKSIYRWDNINEPKELEFDKNTSKIIDWKE